MNPVLRQLLESKTVTMGGQTLPLHSNIRPEDGELLQRIIAAVKPATTLEIGMAYGVSTLYICEALSRLRQPARHIVIDPFQNSDWHGIGLRHVREAGYQGLVTFYEERAEWALPRLVDEGRQVELILFDGAKRFDRFLTQFYFANYLLRVGGVAVFDDSEWPGIHQALRYIVNFPAYRLREWRPARASVLGRLRQRLGRIPMFERLVHPRVLHPSWELGLSGRAVVFEKVAADDRSWDWHCDF